MSKALANETKRVNQLVVKGSHLNFIRLNKVGEKAHEQSRLPGCHRVVDIQIPPLWIATYGVLVATRKGIICNQILQRDGPTKTLFETREITRLIIGGNLISFHSKKYKNGRQT